MKKKLLFVLAAIVSGSISSTSQAQDADSLGLPGDGLDLYAVVDLFKSSNSVEEFEKKLNDEQTGINNLDLNGDGQVDYIRVEDRINGDAHAITLQVPVTRGESQDVAFIAIEKVSADEARLQVIGDEDLYGENYIVEPSNEGKVGGKGGTHFGLFFNVWWWPCVTYIYAPSYVVWYSPWYWDFYPNYWRPWRSCGWYAYHPRFYHYHSYCYRTTTCHNVRSSHAYRSHRAKSATFAQMKESRYSGKGKGNVSGGKADNNGKDGGQVSTNAANSTKPSTAPSTTSGGKEKSPSADNSAKEGNTTLPADSKGDGGGSKGSGKEQSSGGNTEPIKGSGKADSKAEPSRSGGSGSKGSSQPGGSKAGSSKSSGGSKGSSGGGGRSSGGRSSGGSGRSGGGRR